MKAAQSEQSRTAEAMRVIGIHPLGAALSMI
jgi:hypothetical protein